MSEQNQSAEPKTYDPRAVEAHWQKEWASRGTNEVDLDNAQNPFYALMMFPYPSAEGLHVGNLFAFTGSDISARFHRLKGHDVFQPLGYDAFGIHSENYALKIGAHPMELTPKNIANFQRGRLTLELVRKVVRDPSSVRVFACGAAITKWQKQAAKEKGVEPTPPFMETVEQNVHALGVPKAHFKKEEFG